MRLGALERVARQELGALGQVQQDRAGFREIDAGLELQDGRRQPRVLLEVLRLERVTAEDVDRHPLVLTTKLREKDADLVAIRRRSVVVQAHLHRVSLPSIRMWKGDCRARLARGACWISRR